MQKLNRKWMKKVVIDTKGLTPEGKVQQEKHTKGINVEKIADRFKTRTNKKEKRQQGKKKERKKKTPENCKSPAQRQRFITIKM